MLKKLLNYSYLWRRFAIIFFGDGREEFIGFNAFGVIHEERDVFCEILVRISTQEWIILVNSCTCCRLIRRWNTRRCVLKRLKIYYGFRILWRFRLLCSSRIFFWIVDLCNLRDLLNIIVITTRSILWDRSSILWRSRSCSKHIKVKMFMLSTFVVTS